jgi:hypothetical protein
VQSCACQHIGLGDPLRMLLNIEGRSALFLDKQEITMPGRVTRQISNKKLFQRLERPMTTKSIRTNAAESSYFYLVMAESCFRRAVSTPHPKADAMLRKIGRDNLAMANHAPSIRMRNLETKH